MRLHGVQLQADRIDFKKRISIHRAPALLFDRQLRHRPGNAEHVETETHAGFSTEGERKCPENGSAIRMGVQQLNFDFDYSGLGIWEQGATILSFARKKVHVSVLPHGQSHYEHHHTTLSLHERELTKHRKHIPDDSWRSTSPALGSGTSPWRCASIPRRSNRGACVVPGGVRPTQT